MNSFIFLKQGALLKDECQTIINYFNSSKSHFSGKVSNNLLSNKKLSTDLNIDPDVDNQKITRILDNSLSNLVSEYIKIAPSLKSVDSIGNHGYRLRKYSKGDKFDWHIDSFNGSVAKRILAVIWYLNDVKKGGEIEFLYQGTSLPSKAGNAILFPTSFEYVHRSRPIESGEKYIALTFIEHE
ncbi:2OG-Fe(II) oxygenase [Vibrio parahaemolyticus]|uniref:2OG-Fe(II) oxygenase n=1 Tax=Vibrio parahaemolyticus TaxID=670 RepID=UPI0018836015|nr:2OG-Fe(II) oxygenase [Vibrio parahaemolyticus]